MRPALVLLALLLLVAAPLGAATNGPAVEGVDRSRLLPPAGAEVGPYANAGYRLSLEEGAVHIEVDASPLGSESRFQPPKARRAEDQLDAVTRLALSITTGARTDYEAVSRILTWVARNLAYELDRSQAQDPESVLERRSAYCTGIARTTVALVRAVGLEAREVAGFVVGDGEGGPNGFHRWVEIRLPDVGWVFSDPLYSHHYVPANYLRLGSEKLVPSAGTEALLLERQDGLVATDIYPGSVPGVRTRRNTDRRWAAALHVEVDRHSQGLVILESSRTRWRHSLVRGTATFLGLDPGRYRLKLMIAGLGVFERQLEVSGRQRRTLFLSPADAGDSSESTPSPARPGTADEIRGKAGSEAGVSKSPE